MSGTGKDSLCEAIAEALAEGSDLCHCGDFRSQHDEQGCRLCRGTSVCVRFRFASKAGGKDLVTWKQYHAGMKKLEAKR